VVGGRASRQPQSLSGTAAAITMEAWARLLARLDYLRGRERHVWDMVASTKNSPGGTDRLGAGGGEQLEG
jgi:hypothetical protein